MRLLHSSIGVLRQRMMRLFLISARIILSTYLVNISDGRKPNPKE